MVLLLAAIAPGGPLPSDRPAPEDGPELASRTTIKPPALEKGDAIGLVAPASSPPEARVERAVHYLRTRGYTVVLSHGYRDADGYLASNDESRAAEIHRMFADPRIKAIICLRGGYGSPRILDRIDYDLVRENPKVFVGYSDITALLNAIRAKTGLVVFHGPMAKELAASGFPRFSERYFWNAFATESRLFSDWGAGRPGTPLKTLVEGQCEGRLAGGNLSVLTSTIGTPYEVDARGAILFLEEVNEKPYRIDRMLNQLRLSGKLAEARGILLCRFTGCEARSGRDRSLEAIFSEYFRTLGVPVLANYPAGHIEDQATLPMGSLVRLDATAQKLVLLEPAVRSR